MLSFEWQELETLGDQLSSLGRRYAAAQRSEHRRLIEGLQQELARVQRQREALLRHILVRYGMFTAERNRLSNAARHRLPERI